MVIPTASAAALGSVQPSELGKASGIANTAQRFGSVIGIAIVTAVFDAKGSLASQPAITSGYRPALAVAASFSVIGAFVALAVRRASAAGPVSFAPRRDAVPAVVAAAVPAGRDGRDGRGVCEPAFAGAESPSLSSQVG
jgi:hypothetical protein